MRENKFEAKVLMKERKGRVAVKRMDVGYYRFQSAKLDGAMGCLEAMTV